MLKITTDPAQRRVIEKLRLDEEAKLKKREEITSRCRTSSIGAGC